MWEGRFEISVSGLGSRALCFIALPHPVSSALEFGVISVPVLLLLFCGADTELSPSCRRFASLVKTVLVSGSRISSWKEMLLAILLAHANNQGNSFERYAGFLL